MRPRDFLKALLDAKGLTANGLAMKVNRPAAQGNISRYLTGDVQNPRGAWVELAGKELGFDPAALIYEATAEREYARLMGQKSGAGNQVSRAPIPLPAKSKRTAIDPGMLVIQIADLMRAFDQDQRDLAAPLFAGAARAPDKAPAIAASVRALLDGQQKRNDATGT